MDFPIQFCTSADGVRIAYTAIGEGRTLVAVPTWSANFELDWQHSDGRGYIEDLSHGRRLVLFDRRGCGSSQRDGDDLSLDAHVGDVASLADHLALDRFDLWGDKDGAAVAVAYATRYPERVSRLVLWAPFACAADIGPSEAHRSLAELARGNWGLFRRALAKLRSPS